MTNRKDISNFILKKYLEKQKDLVEEAMLYYGSVITKGGRVLTVTEMENLRLSEDVQNIIK